MKPIIIYDFILEMKNHVVNSKNLLNLMSLAIRKLKKRVKFKPVRREALKRKYAEKLFELLAEKMLNLEAIENLIEDGGNRYILHYKLMSVEY